MTASNLQVSKAGQDENLVLANLMNHYFYDMAEWFEINADPDGFYSYNLEEFWTQKFQVYIARLDEIPVGFALIEQLGDLRDLKEFFILRQHRRARFGQELCNHVWSAHRGNWQVRVYRGNRPAVPFWKQVISDYTSGKYTEAQVNKEDKPWTHYHFQNNS